MQDALVPNNFHFIGIVGNKHTNFLFFLQTNVMP